MNETNMIAIFNNPEFGQVRTVTIDGEPWFVAADVCAALDISNTTVATERLDSDERSKLNLGRRGETNVVSESGLYTLVMASRKKNAHVFKRWVTHEVLPSIRRHGGYMTPATAKQFQALLASQQELLAAQQAKLEKLEHYIAKIGKNQNYTNYFLLREFGSGTKSGWKNTVSARLKVIEDATSIAQFDQLRSVYTYMWRKFGINWEQHRDLYRRVHEVEKPSTLDVVCDSELLMSKFDAAMDELFGRLELPIPEVPEPKLPDGEDDPFDKLVARAKEHMATSPAI